MNLLDKIFHRKTHHGRVIQGGSLSENEASSPIDCGKRPSSTVMHTTVPPSPSLSASGVGSVSHTQRCRKGFIWLKSNRHHRGSASEINQTLPKNARMLETAKSTTSESPSIGEPTAAGNPKTTISGSTASETITASYSSDTPTTDSLGHSSAQPKVEQLNHQCRVPDVYSSTTGWNKEKLQNRSRIANSLDRLAVTPELPQYYNQNYLTLLPSTNYNHRILSATSSEVYYPSSSTIVRPTAAMTSQNDVYYNQQNVGTLPARFKKKSEQPANAQQYVTLRNQKHTVETQNNSVAEEPTPPVTILPATDNRHFYAGTSSNRSRSLTPAERNVLLATSSGVTPQFSISPIVDAESANTLNRRRIDQQLLVENQEVDYSKGIRLRNSSADSNSTQRSLPQHDAQVIATSATKSSTMPAMTQQQQNRCLVYLVYRGETRRALLPMPLSLSLEQLLAFFYQSFPSLARSRARLFSPTFLVLDPRSTIYQQLVDMRQIGDRCVVKLVDNQQGNWSNPASPAANQQHSQQSGTLRLLATSSTLNPPDYQQRQKQDSNFCVARSTSFSDFGGPIDNSSTYVNQPLIVPAPLNQNYSEGGTLRRTTQHHQVNWNDTIGRPGSAGLTLTPSDMTASQYQENTQNHHVNNRMTMSAMSQPIEVTETKADRRPVTSNQATPAAPPSSSTVDLDTKSRIERMEVQLASLRSLLQNALADDNASKNSSNNNNEKPTTPTSQSNASTISRTAAKFRRQEEGDYDKLNGGADEDLQTLLNQRKKMRIQAAQLATDISLLKQELSDVRRRAARNENMSNELAKDFAQAITERFDSILHNNRFKHTNHLSNLAQCICLIQSKLCTKLDSYVVATWQKQNSPSKSNGDAKCNGDVAFVDVDEWQRLSEMMAQSVEHFRETAISLEHIFESLPPSADDGEFDNHNLQSEQQDAIRTLWSRIDHLTSNSTSLKELAESKRQYALACSHEDEQNLNQHHQKPRGSIPVDCTANVQTLAAAAAASDVQHQCVEKQTTTEDFTTATTILTHQQPNIDGKVNETPILTSARRESPQNEQRHSDEQKNSTALPAPVLPSEMINASEEHHLVDEDGEFDNVILIDELNGSEENICKEKSMAPHEQQRNGSPPYDTLANDDKNVDIICERQKADEDSGETKTETIITTTVITEEIPFRYAKSIISTTTAGARQKALSHSPPVGTMPHNANETSRQKPILAPPPAAFADDVPILVDDDDDNNQTNIRKEVTVQFGDDAEFYNQDSSDDPQNDIVIVDDSQTQQQHQQLGLIRSEEIANMFGYGAGLPLRIDGCFAATSSTTSQQQPVSTVNNCRERPAPPPRPNKEKIAAASVAVSSKIDPSSEREHYVTSEFQAAQSRKSPARYNMDASPKPVVVAVKYSDDDANKSFAQTGSSSTTARVKTKTSLIDSRPRSMLFEQSSSFDDASVVARNSTAIAKPNPRPVSCQFESSTSTPRKQNNCALNKFWNAPASIDDADKNKRNNSNEAQCQTIVSRKHGAENDDNNIDDEDCNVVAYV